MATLSFMTSNLNYLYILRGIHFVLPDKYSTYAMHLKSQLTAHIYDFPRDMWPSFD